MTWEMPVFPVESGMLREISNPSVGGSNPPGRNSFSGMGTAFWLRRWIDVRTGCGGLGVTGRRFEV